MPVLTNIIALTLSTILTKVAWEKLILKVLINLLRWVERSSSTQVVKDVVDSVADELEAVVSGKPVEAQEPK